MTLPVQIAGRCLARELAIPESQSCLATMRPSKPFNWEIGVPKSGYSAYGQGWDFSAARIRPTRPPFMTEADVPMLELNS